MMTNQRRRKYKLSAFEYSDAELTARLLSKVGKWQITADRVLRARGRMLRGKSNGPADCLVVEMLSRLPTEVIYEVTHWFQKRFQGDAELWRSGEFCAWCSSRSLMQDWRRGSVVSLRLLYCVFSKWYTTVLVDLLHEEKEPIEWMSLHVGAERGVNCEHMQGLLTNLLQKHWEWQENRRKDLEPGKFKYKTMYMASLDVKTAFNVAKPSVVS